MNAMIDGKKITLGGKEWVIPPLNLAALKKHARLFDAAASGRLSLSSDNIEALSDLIYLALKRNYPEITTGEVDELLDMSNLMTVFSAVSSVSVAQGEEEGPR